MPDETYDAVIVGGGNKALIVGMYLAKYGGMSVGIFEKRHEAGGGWCSDEGPAPGFIGDYHATAVGPFWQTTTEMDFQEWKDLGVRYNEVEFGAGAIFKETDEPLMIYNRKADPTLEKSAASIARFSKRDADTWVRLQPLFGKIFWTAMLEWVHNPPTPPGVPDALERLAMDPSLKHYGVDPSWLVKTPLEIAREVFESDEIIATAMRYNETAVGNPPDIPGTGIWGFLYAISLMRPMHAGVTGGTHNWAHAAVKILLKYGGKIFTKHEVEKVTIENGKATGIQLKDGSRIGARKMVISTLDPYSLCFKLIGEQNLSWSILRKVANLERRITCITWYTWALHEHPRYKAGDINPDISRAMSVMLISKDPETLCREMAKRKLGIMPHDLQLNITNHSLVDKFRCPEGKSAILTEQFVIPANLWTERQWVAYKKEHAEEIIKCIGDHAYNMNWDNVLGYAACTPYDHCKLDNMAPTGNWAIIDNLPGQLGRNRPIPEFSSYRTPIQNLYATGSGWHPLAMSAAWGGYCCYKILAQDYGLNKPWESEGRPW
ncbi:MAG: NAD(P)/FAD-dependent oxidoreductase [Dehalococcoidia bacterium]|nr:NAD(P)/FAD-dependent oxidoreductase [Dehalococcoidia bacterium]